MITFRAKFWRTEDHGTWKDDHDEGLEICSHGLSHVAHVPKSARTLWIRTSQRPKCLDSLIIDEALFELVVEIGLELEFDEILRYSKGGYITFWHDGEEEE